MLCIRLYVEALSLDMLIVFVFLFVVLLVFLVFVFRHRLGCQLVIGVAM